MMNYKNDRLSKTKRRGMSKTAAETSIATFQPMSLGNSEPRKNALIVS